jgi:TerC family integral membrane protein
VSLLTETQEITEITEIHSIAGPAMWWITIAAVLALVVMDFIITHKPHEVKFKEAVRWSIFYIALPVAFGGWLWLQYGHDVGVKYYTGYVVEKSLSVDNLFVFILILSAFAVPKVLQQRVLLIGVVGALALRGVFIWLGAAMISRFDWTFLFFGAVLLVTAVKVLRDAFKQEDAEIEPNDIMIVRILRKFWPVTGEYNGTKMTVQQGARRALTPLALVIAAVMVTDVVFAIDSIPAVYGITSDPYLVFATNAFALLGLRALYFVLEGALSRLVHLGFGLAAILAFIGFKLVAHWAHDIWTWVPEIPTLLSLGVIVVILSIVTATSLYATRNDPKLGEPADAPPPATEPDALTK